MASAPMVSAQLAAPPPVAALILEAWRVSPV
jgi:hypothetical protein